MAINALNSNLVSDIMNEGANVLALRDRLELVIARWNLNDAFNQLNDADLAANSTFAHLTKSEVANAITALSAILTALGDDVSGQATNLIKLKG